MAARYEPSRAGWKAIAMSPGILAACVGVAEEGKAYAQTISPRSGDGSGVAYVESFEVNPTVTTGGRYSPRVSAELRNTAPHAAAVEFGNRQRPSADRVFGRTEAHLAGGA